MTTSELKFLVDVGVGRNVEEFLEDKGYDSKFIRSIDPRLSDNGALRSNIIEIRRCYRNRET